jgi:hypothetical protein
MGSIVQICEPGREEPETLSYEICARDRIVAISENWPNPGHRHDVLHHLLWDLMGDGNIADVYRALVTQIRRTRAGVTFTLRCDDQYTRRVVSMSMTPTSGGGIRFSSRPIVQERQDSQAFLHQRKKLSLEVDLCPTCGNIKVGEQWQPAGSALESLGIFADDLPFRTWTVHCPQCRSSGH